MRINTIVIALILSLMPEAEARAHQSVASSSVAEATFAPAVVRADLADLYATLQLSHYDLFARTKKADYDAAFADISAAIEQPMHAAQIAALFQRFLAAGRVAHARIDGADGGFAAYREAGGKMFPLGIRVVDRRLFVVRNRSGEDAVRPGDEILALNGLSANQWLEQASMQISADTPYMLGALLEWDFARIVWATLDEPTSFELRIARPGGGYQDLIVPARSRAEMDAAAERQPGALDLSWDRREARMIEDRIAYLRPGPTYNVEGGEATMYDTRAFKSFVDNAFELFLENAASDLVIDLRDNPGGDNSFSDLMVAWFATRPFRFNSQFRIRVSPATIASNAARLAVPGNDPTGVSATLAARYSQAEPGSIIDFPVAEAPPRAERRFEGRVYALVNRQSYSNTVAIAATLQDYGFAVIIGEETSDLATTYGAMETFTLPRTGIVVGYPKALIVRPSGDLQPRGVVPDIAIATPILEGPDDPVLQDALALVRERRLANPVEP